MYFHSTGYLSHIVMVPLLVVMAASCSNDSPSTGKLDLSVADTAVDEADKVVVEFTGVTIHGANGASQAFSFPAKQIDLLALQGGEAEKILDGQTLAAGDYSWIRLDVEDTNSYIMVNGKQHMLEIPSGNQSGLKLNRTITIPPGGLASFTIDFDLRKSVVKTAVDEYKLRPTLRLVDDFTKGALAGSVDATVLSAECNSSSIYAGAVYVFDAGVVAPDDVDGNEPDPLNSAIVDVDTQTYIVGNLETGDYKISYTCEADQDNQDNDDALSFTPLLTVTIHAGETTEQDINP